MNLIQTTFLLCILFVAVVNDFRFQKIPNLLTLPCILAAVAYSTFTRGLEGLIFSGGGVLFGILLLFPIYLMGGMGAGDAKLMGAVGGFIGPKAVLYAFTFTAIAGGLYALLLIVIHRSQFQGFFKEKKEELLSIYLTKKFTPGSTTVAATRRPRLCYALAIAVGTCTYIILNVTGAVAFGQ